MAATLTNDSSLRAAESKNVPDTEKATCKGWQASDLHSCTAAGVRPGLCMDNAVQASECRMATHKTGHAYPGLGMACKWQSYVQ